MPKGFGSDDRDVWKFSPNGDALKDAPGSTGKKELI
jgi:hypothetical protein